MSSFPFLITLMLFASTCTHGEEHVLDAAGNPVQTTEQYFIQSVVDSYRGGLNPTPVKLFPLCPLGISQALTSHIPGIPVSFSYPYPLMDTDVYTMQFVNIEFKSDRWPGCEEFSKLWEVDESSYASEEPAILVGGKKRERNSWFRIERVKNFVGGNAYKLTTLTGTIGTVPGPWAKEPQLVLTNDTAKTFFVQFHMFYRDTTAPTSTLRVEK